MYKNEKGVKQITIDDGESESGIVDIARFAGGIVMIDSALDACDLALYLSDAAGGTFYKYGFINDAAASNAYVLPDDVFHARFAKFISHSAGTTTPLAQSGDVVLTLTLVEDLSGPVAFLDRNIKSVTIADSGTASTAADIQRESGGSVALPSGWDTQNIAFHVAPSYGGTYVPLNTWAGVAIGITGPVALTIEEIDSDVFKAPFMKVVSASAQSGAVTLPLFLGE